MVDNLHLVGVLSTLDWLDWAMVVRLNAVHDKTRRRCAPSRVTTITHHLE